MSGDYVALIPLDPMTVPTEDKVAAALDVLEKAGAVRREGDAWYSGTNLGAFLVDPTPVVRDGQNVLTAGKSPVSWRTYPYVKGHSGINFEPIGCKSCSAELPFDEMLAALGSADGSSPVQPGQLTLVCFHCKKPNDALKEDYGMSGGFSRFELKIEVPTNRFMEPLKSLVAAVSAAMGTEMRLIQIIEG